MKCMLAKGKFNTKKTSSDVEVLIPGSMFWSNKTLLTFYSFYKNRRDTHLVVMRFEYEHYTTQTGTDNKDRD